MKHAAKSACIVILCTCMMVMTLPLCAVTSAEGANPGMDTDASSVPALDAAGTAIPVSETDKENLTRLFAAANPSDLLISFDVGDEIDDAMWLAGFAAGYHSGEAESDTGLFEEDPFFTEDEEAHFAGLWATYFDGWEPLDGANPPANILPYSMDGRVSDSMYYRMENAFMQSLIKGIYGREMIAPEEHIRYYDGCFYFGHIGDREERLWFGYDYTVDTVYDVSNGYYKIEGKAELFDYADGHLEDTKAYEALVKKDVAAEYTYFLIAQRFSD